MQFGRMTREGLLNRGHFVRDHNKERRRISVSTEDAAAHHTLMIFYSYCLQPNALACSRRESRSEKVSGRLLTSRSRAEGW